MATLGEFLAMGGHAAFVWPAYGVAAVVMVGLVVTSLRTARAAEAEVKVLEDGAPARRRARTGSETGPGTGGNAT